MSIYVNTSIVNIFLLSIMSHTTLFERFKRRRVAPTLTSDFHQFKTSFFYTIQGYSFLFSTCDKATTPETAKEFQLHLSEFFRLSRYSKTWPAPTDFASSSTVLLHRSFTVRSAPNSTNSCRAATEPSAAAT